MATVYATDPDGRQEGDIKPTRFRPRYRQLTDEEKQLHDDIKTKATELEALYDKINGGKPGRYKSLAMTSLEESVMWGVKELTA